MNYLIDLKTKIKKKKSLSLQQFMLFTILWTVLILLFLYGSCWVYQVSLNRKVVALTDAIASLETQASDLIDLQQKLIELDHLNSIDATITKPVLSSAEIMNKIMSAGSETTETGRLYLENDGLFHIQGSADRMPDIAHYHMTIDEMQGIKSADLIKTEKDNMGGYLFSLMGKLELMEGTLYDRCSENSNP